jgi:hypothetical protein
VRGDLRRYRPRAPAAARHASQYPAESSCASSTTRSACRSPGILYPIVGILVSPIWASAAMTLSSLSVIGNALRDAIPVGH